MLLLPFIAFTAVSCSDDDKPTILMNHIEGNWEVVKYDHPEYTTIYDIRPESSSLPTSGSIGYKGMLTTYYLTVGNPPRHDKEFSWKIVTVEDGQYPLIELVWEADLDEANGDAPANRFYYRIEELTATTMRWYINSVTGEETIDFIRRADLDSE